MLPGILILGYDSGNTISNNLLRRFGISGAYTSDGINIQGGENWTISGNTIFSDEPGGRYQGLYGIYFYAQGTNTIPQNTIYVSPTGDGYLSREAAYGIDPRGAGNTTVSHNRITLTGMAPNYADFAVGRWYGIYINAGAGGTFTLANNQVTISPVNSVRQYSYGILDNGSSGSTLNAYHNSVCIGGTPTDGATWAYRRTTVAEDTTTLKNNIFFNDCSGGSVNHFAAGNQSASGSFTSDYNLFAGTGTTAASFMDWGMSISGTPVDLATWQASSGGDSHSYADVAANIPAASLFTDPATGDLSIRTGAGFEAPPLPSNRGGTGTGVADDYNGTPRSTTMPDLGAFEFDVDRSGLAGPGTLAGGWGYYDTLGIASGAVTAGADVNVVDLTMAAGATLDMAAHTLNVVISGTAISDQQDVSGGSDFTFLGPTGVVINPGDTLPLGLTGVTIRFLGAGTTSCVSGWQPTVRRCSRSTRPTPPAETPPYASTSMRTAI